MLISTHVTFSPFCHLAHSKLNELTWGDLPIHKAPRNLHIPYNLSLLNML